MPINVSEALCADTAEAITVERSMAGAYVDGIYQQGGTFTFKTIASVQQPLADDLQNLPEGERDKDIKKFISKKQIKTTDDRGEIPADVVIYNSVRYKIIAAQDWNAYGHTTAFGARVR